MTITRRTHVVRLYPGGADQYQSDGGVWIDVEVLDALGLLTPSEDEALFEVRQTSDAPETTENDDRAGEGGEERVYDCTAENALPYIVDNTGDNNGNSTTGTDPTMCTRSSHCLLYTSRCV